MNIKSHCLNPKIFSKFSSAVLLFLMAVSLLFPNGKVNAQMFDNGGFENNTLTPWTVTSFFSQALTDLGNGKYAINEGTGSSVDATSVVGGVNGPLGYQDAATNNGTDVLKYPRFGNYAAVVNYNVSSNNANRMNSNLHGDISRYRSGRWKDPCAFRLRAGVGKSFRSWAYRTALFLYPINQPKQIRWK